MELNIQQIMEILPHRPPFLLVDRITECEPGVKATGVKCVTMNEPFFVGHFPGNPIMPGVLILEALAQTGAVGRPLPAGEPGKAGHLRRREERPLQAAGAPRRCAGAVL